MSGLFLTAGRRLKLLQEHDHHTQWWDLDETRVCRICGHLIIGKNILITLDEKELPHFACPSFKCSGSLDDLDYPRLNL